MPQGPPPAVGRLSGPATAGRGRLHFFKKVADQKIGVSRPNGHLLNAVANCTYIDRLKRAIEQLHHCAAVYVCSSPVTEVFNGRTVWQGDVEVFKIEKHPRARRCFAWAHREGKDAQDERIVIVLEIPPVVSPQIAVRTQTVKDVKDSYSH